VGSPRDTRYQIELVLDKHNESLNKIQHRIKPYSHKSNHITTKLNKNQTSKQEDLITLVWDLDLAVKNQAAIMALCAGPAAGQGLVFDRQLLGQGKYNTTLRPMRPS
jgi:hypothetical protein